MAISFQDVQTKTISEIQLAVFKENYFTIDQISSLLQLKGRLAALRYIQPREMKMVELFYHPIDKQDESIITSQTKQLKTRYFIPKEVWAQFITESGWAIKTSRSITERFTFKINNKLMHLLVVHSKSSKDIESDELFNSLSNWRRQINITIETKKTKNDDYKCINKAYFYKIAQLCNSLAITSPENVRPLQFFDPNQAAWLYRTSLFFSDLVVDYQESYDSLSLFDRFNKYLNDALSTEDQSIHDDLRDEMLNTAELLTTSIHPFSLFNPENANMLLSIQEDPLLRFPLINSLLQLHNEFKSLSQRHNNVLPGIRFSREKNEDLLQDYHYVYDLIHSHKFYLPDNIQEGYHPEIFEIVCSATYQLLEILGGKDARLTVAP
ncbi:hypothetical protein ACFYU8_18345 [Brevibacillus sp. NPDC003359]|uniref:hypothetical protein n=1 Tax=unclassified Brevibacillus TaxID=2684853 RepID=UPI0036B0D2E1